MTVIQNAGSVLHARRNLYLQRVRASYYALAFALAARVLNHHARALANRAGAGHAEESLLIAHLAMAVALAALARCFAVGRSVAMTGFAHLTAADVHFSFHAKCRVFKTDGEIFSYVGALLRAPAPASAAATSEQIAEAEHLSEQVADVDVLEAALSATAAVGEGIMAIAIVGSALFLIAEHRVRLAAFLEALFRLVIAGITIRVKLQCQFAVGALDLAVGRGAGDAEYFVIIAFNVSSQCSKDRRGGRPPWRIAPGPVYLFVRVLSYANHGRAQNAVAQPVAAL